MRTRETFEIESNLSSVEIKKLITLKLLAFVADCTRDSKAFSLKYNELSNERFSLVYDKSINEFALEIIKDKNGIEQVKFQRRKLSIS